MKVLFRISLVWLMTCSGMIAQQFYTKEIQDTPTDQVEVFSTSDGGFLVFNTLPLDSSLFQLIKYDTCGNLVWTNRYFHKQSDSIKVIHPLVAMDNRDQPHIVFLTLNGSDTSLILLNLDETGNRISQYEIDPGVYFDQLDHIAYHEVKGLFVTAHKVDSVQHITYLMSIQLSGTINWVQSSADQYYGVSVVNDTALLVSSYPDEQDSNVVISALDIDGIHQWRRQYNNLRPIISNIVESNNQYMFAGSLLESPSDTQGLLITLGLLGDIIQVSQRFTTSETGILLKNERGLLYLHHDTLRSFLSNDDITAFTVFTANGDLQTRLSFNLIPDTLRRGQTFACVLANNINLAIGNRAKMDSTVNKIVVGKTSAPNYAFGMGCNLDPFEQVDTAILISEDSLALVTLNNLNWKSTLTESINARVTMIEDETICMISPKSFEAPSPQCIGETVEFFDPLQQKLLRITSDTTVITRKYIFCGEQIIESTKFTFALPDVSLPLPLAFTPNNDNQNDLFGVILDTMQNTSFSSFEMRIYNRWGNQVFESNNITQQWDGQHKGNPAPQEIYIYYISYKGKLNDVCDIEGTIKGDVTLIR